MTAIPLLSGVVASNQAEFTTSYPLNLEPIAVANGIANGQLRAAAGASQLVEGPGIDRGGVWWRGFCYRVMGTILVKVAIDGALVEVGDVGGEGAARFDYGFDRLIIRSSETLWYYDEVNLTQVTDEDLGPVKDMMWISGFTMTTDGTNVIVTELSDPFQILPLKYGSAEEDPDMVTGLMKVRNEPYILGRHTIQVFRNIGGNGFPFVTIPGATIPFGCVSASAKCYFASSFAFVGGARGEAVGVYVAGQGTADKISTRAVDDALAAEVDVEGIILEARVSRDEQRLFVHLANESWVFLATASIKLQQPIWYRCASNGPYRIRNAVDCGTATLVGDLETAFVGTLSDDISTHFGEEVEWEFVCGLVYNKGKGGVVQTVELAGLPGRGPAEDPRAFMSMTRDGQSWSAERAISLGAPGNRRKRMVWRPGSRFSNYIGLKFRGVNSSMAGFAACEADIRPLNA